MTKRIIISFFILLIIGTLAIIGYFLGYWKFNYPSNSEFPVRGIDVSHHQGEIDWDKVSRQGVDFVYIKASEGSNFKDPEFSRNWRNVASTSLSRGAYHFFTFHKSGIDQAKNFIGTVPIEAGVLPPVIDFEFTGNSKNVPPKETVLRELSEFVRQVEKIYGKTPIIYVTQSSYKSFFKEESDHYRFWIRDIIQTPDLSDRGKWVFWQYANNGRIQGINGRVDLNVFTRSHQKFQECVQ
jgi:lysozyme